jgi:RimJ/RimL family protein N-acetyltransferase
VSKKVKPLTVTLRRARLADGPMVLAWRNDPDARRMSSTTRKVTQREHGQWWPLRYGETRIAMVGVEPVGYWRVRDSVDIPGAGEVSIVVDQAWRGKGLAHAIIAQGTRSALRRYRTCVAWVALLNQRSLCAFGRFGYAPNGDISTGKQKMIMLVKRRRQR